MKLRQAMDQLDPFVAAAKPATRNLAAFFKHTRPFLSRARTVVPRVADIFNTKGNYNDLKDLFSSGTKAGQIASSALPNAINFFNASEPDVALLRAYTPDIFGAISNLDDITSHYDANGHYARALPVLGAAHYNVGLNQLEPQPVSDRLNGFQLGMGARCPGAGAPPAPDSSSPVVVPGCNPLDYPPGP